MMFRFAVFLVYRAHHKKGQDTQFEHPALYSLEATRLHAERLSASTCGLRIGVADFETRIH